MSSSFGRDIKLSIFGGSHTKAIGVNIDGLPAGEAIDWDQVLAQMARRAPGQDKTATTRKEPDLPQVLCGLLDGVTTGAPLCAIIENTSQRSKDYENLYALPRPGHADYTAWVKYGGHNDLRGGGHFSGRLTAPLVFAGAVAKLVLKEHGVTVSAHVSNLAGIPGPSEEQAQAAILAAKAEGDSVGGCVRCLVEGLPAGLGSPDFGCNVEGIFAQYLFAVPAVKGISFGAGFALAAMRGSEANDPFCLEGDHIATATNHAGGVNGGITNGMPVDFEVVFRPTPSISKPQRTVSLSRMEEAELIVEGRHDPCVVLRAVPVVEAAAALAACEVLGI